MPLITFGTFIKLTNRASRTARTKECNMAKYWRVKFHEVAKRTVVGFVWAADEKEIARKVAEGIFTNFCDDCDCEDYERCSEYDEIDFELLEIDEIEEEEAPAEVIRDAKSSLGDTDFEVTAQ